MTWRRVMLGLLMSSILAVCQPAPAFAGPPANDDTTDATDITQLPFTATADIVEATLEPGESCAAKSAWYRYRAPASGFLEATIAASYTLVPRWRCTSVN